MKKLYLLFTLILLLGVSNIQAQWNSPNRYTQPVFAQNLISKTDYVYNAFGSTGFPGFSGALTLYKPLTTTHNNIGVPIVNDPVPNRPLIVLIHGGGFIPGQGDRGTLETSAYAFATMGYVVASIDYRLYNDPAYAGINANFMTEAVTPNNPVAATNGTSSLPWYVAVQDLNAAVKYLCYNASNFQIGPNKVFLMGESAGAVTALSFALGNQADFDTYFNFSGNNNVGPINITTLQQCKTQTYTIKGVFTLSGALPYESFLSSNDQIPLLMQHCTSDQVVPIDGFPGFKKTLGDNEIINRLKNWNQNGISYPCSYLYRTAYGYSTVDSGYHGLTSDARVVFNSIAAKFFSDILNNSVVCKRDDYSVAVGVNLISSLYSLPARIGITSEEGLEMSLFPNPALTEITLAGLTENSNVDIQIFDVQGKLVLSQSFTTDDSENSRSLSVADLPTGLYLLNIKDTSQSKQFKFIKQ